MKTLALLLLLTLLSGCAEKTASMSYGSVPDFSLTERSNRKVTKRDLAGKVWVADFIFTHCAGTCPVMSTNMRKLQDKLPAEIHLVSFSVDPYNDTPEVLAEYAKRYEADPNRWLFLTGEPGAVQKLSFEGFKLAIDTSSGTTAEPITHSSRYALVDKDGTIRGYFGTDEPDSLDRIVEAAKKLL